MAKKLIAVTEIRHNDDVIAAGETLDASKFEKKQLEALYDAGAVRVEGSGEETAEQTTEPANTTVSADQSAEASSPAPAPAKSTSAPAVKETANAKGSTK